MSGALVPAAGTGLERILATSALTRVAADAVTDVLATVELDVVAGAGLRITAFPAELLDDPDGLTHLVHGPPLPGWTRNLSLDDGRIRIGSHERLGVWWPERPQDMVHTDELRALLDRLGTTVAWLSVSFAGTADELVDLLAGRTSIVGLAANFSDVDDTEPLDVLARLEHLQFLVAHDWSVPTTRETVRRLARLEKLRGLYIGLVRADALAPLDDLPRLRRLQLMLDADSGRWEPQLPALRSMSVDAPFAPFPPLGGCPGLFHVGINGHGCRDKEIDEVAALPAVRQLRIGGMAQNIVSPAGAERLASLVRLQRCSVNLLEVPDGRLRLLRALAALEFLSVGAVGATEADRRWLATRLPRTALHFRRYRRVRVESGLTRNYPDDLTDHEFGPPATPWPL